MTEIKTSQANVPDGLRQFRWMACFTDGSIHLGIGPTEGHAVADLKIKYLRNQIAGGAK